ncbi:MAG TPA: arginine deiminase-related protein [Streptosporangiaceae bacterium]|nr:arginine deiminase-related protein [Streptosporangiaceae bacterium]
MTETTPRRSSHARTYLMCPPAHFTVEYAINPWMNPDQPVDAGLAMRQWEQLQQAFTDLGHTVHTINPEPGLPDMVFAANGATVIDGKVLGARFKHAERQPEAEAYMRWFREDGYAVVREPIALNEGEGDIVHTGRAILAGYGFRTDQAVSGELADLFGLPVISLRLVDPRFYHLDTALVVLDPDTVAYYPAAFDDASRAALASHFGELIEVKDEDAEVLGLNAISDGRNVVLPMQATSMIAQLASAGFTPIGVDLSELLKAGGGPKCCTLELRR